MKSRRRAVIDIGTNSVKLLVGDVVDGIVYPVEERSDQTRLGAGFYETHILQANPITRTASAVARFVAMARDQDAESVRVIATSAARDARNADVLLDAVRRAAGLRVEIISGDREAEWVFAGVTTDPRLHGQRLLILDVGGGSTEFIVGERDRFSFRESFDLGSVRLLELLRPHDPPSVSDVAATRDWLKKFFNFRVAPRMLAPLGEDPGRNIRLVGTGGTTTILARMELKVDRFDREKIEGTILARDTVLDYMFRLWSMSLAQRRSIPGLPGNRADVIIMGVAIYEIVMEQFNFADLYVSMRGLRYGAILQQS